MKFRWKEAIRRTMAHWTTKTRGRFLTVTLTASLASCTVAEKPPASSADSLKIGDAASAVTSDSAQPLVTVPADPSDTLGTQLEGQRPPPTPVPGGLTVSEIGIGPVRAGMTIGQANAALGGILRIPRKLNECDFLSPASGPRIFMLMVERGRVARVDVPDSSGISTVAGARVGDSEARIMSLYPGRVKVQPHKYTSGHYLVVTPASRADSAFRIVFETDGSKVVRYRSGRRPAVEYVEGCA